MPAPQPQPKELTLIKVYSRPRCVQCNATYRALDKAGITYEKVDASQSAEATEFVKSLGYLEAPVVYVDENNHWSGFRPDLINELVK